MRAVLIISLVCLLGFTGCQTRPLATATNEPDSQTATFNVVVVVLHGLYELPLHVRPKALGGKGEACPQLDQLIAGGLRLNNLVRSPSPSSLANSSDTKAWLQVASHGAHVCALVGTGVDLGVSAGADWWVGQANSAAGLPQRDKQALTGYASHFPVRRRGMTAPVAQPITRPWLLQIGDEIDDFILFQEREASPYALVVELNVSNTQLQTPDENSLRLWRSNRSPADTIALARLDMANSVISTTQSSLVWFEKVQHTLWVVVADDGPPGTPPLLVLHWPQTVSPGAVSVPTMNVNKLQEALATLVAGRPIEKGLLPAELAQELNHGLRRENPATEKLP